MTASRDSIVWIVGALVALAGCSAPAIIPIETPLPPKLDTAGFERVLVAGFTVASEAPLDLNGETSRILRNQLGGNPDLQVLDAEFGPLEDFSRESLKETGRLADFQTAAREASAGDGGRVSLDEWIAFEEERLLRDEAYWRELGEEYGEPLIVSGSLRFASRVQESRAPQLAEADDRAAPRSVFERNYLQEIAFVLEAEFLFIDGESGRIIHREKYTEEAHRRADEEIAALGVYFELMDRILPNVVNVVLPQDSRAYRVLLR